MLDRRRFDRRALAAAADDAPAHRQRLHAADLDRALEQRPGNTERAARRRRLSRLRDSGCRPRVRAVLAEARLRRRMGTAAASATTARAAARRAASERLPASDRLEVRGDVRRDRLERRDVLQPEPRRRLHAAVRGHADRRRRRRWQLHGVGLLDAHARRLPDRRGSRRHGLSRVRRSRPARARRRLHVAVQGVELPRAVRPRSTRVTRSRPAPVLPDADRAERTMHDRQRLHDARRRVARRPIRSASRTPSTSSASTPAARPRTRTRTTTRRGCTRAPRMPVSASCSAHNFDRFAIEVSTDVEQSQHGRIPPCVEAFAQ